MPKTKIFSLPEYEFDNNLTAQQNTYARLRYSLMVGAIEPGRAITIRGLAAASGLSPTPIREALRRLCSEGALQVLENRRIIVPEMTERRFEELVCARIQLETHAALRAMPYISDHIINKLEKIDAQVDLAYKDNELVTGIILNQQFHLTLYKTNPETVLIPMIESLWLQLGPFIRVAATHVKEFYTIDRHFEILAALKKRDEGALIAAIDADISDGVGGLTKQALKQMLN
ncbi:MAG: GntR family transcriptional regulator [Rhizobiales bacterium]|nr:GntR family transcriptional regulator [Hyphomicrobiales bacterium]